MVRSSLRSLAVAASLAALVCGATPAPVATAATGTPIQVYGAWHCFDDYCTWGHVRTVTEFDAKNHWLIDRGGGRPSVNLVVLSFVNPLKLLNGTTDATTVNGIPRGMTPDIVGYFTSHGVRVMVSIGGITYTKDWNTALATNATLLGQRAAALATSLGVGVEIDYEEASSPNLAGLQAFIDVYRSVHGYDATGADPTARLTIDLAAGDRWLIGITAKATADWLTTVSPVLDYANAMVPSKQPSTSEAIASWQAHVDGKPRYNPPILPLAPAKLTGGLYVAEGSRVRPECTSFATSLQASTGSFVQTVAPKVGTTAGMLGYMFWAAEKPSTREAPRSSSTSATGPASRCTRSMRSRAPSR